MATMMTEAAKARPRNWQLHNATLRPPQRRRHSTGKSASTLATRLLSNFG